MNCANHPETPASAFCRQCGKPICQECQRPALGSVYCGEHVPFAAAPPYTPPQPSASPYAAPPPPPPLAPAVDSGAHPALALILGFIPGVGAIYNGQYAKGLVHAVIFGLLVSMENSFSRRLPPYDSLLPLGGILIAAWVFYMVFEAYHTARKRRYGVSVEEFSSLLDVRPSHGRFPAGAILLIALGFILLLDTTDIVNMEQLLPYWPAGLIVLGLYMLYARLNHPSLVHTARDEDDARAPR